MFVTATMKHLLGSVLLEDVDKVTRVFLECGVVEPVAISDLEGSVKEGFTSHYNTDVQQQIELLLQQYKGVFDLGKISVPEVDDAFLKNFKNFKIQECEKFITGVHTTLAGSMFDINTFEKNIQQKKSLLSALRKYVTLSESVTTTSESFEREDSSVTRALHICAGRIHLSKFTSFQKGLEENHGVFFEQIGNGNEVLIKLLYLGDVSDDINHILQQAEWIEIPLQFVHVLSHKQTIVMLVQALQNLENSLQDVHKKIVVQVMHYKRKLIQNWKELNLCKLQARFESNFARTLNVCFFSGWIPARYVKKVVNLLIKETAGHIVLEVRRVGKVRGLDGELLIPPTSIVNPNAFRPFENLIKVYSVPAYNTLDPTFFVAALFVFVFGFMFADVGHGFVISSFGVMMLFFMKKKRDLGFLMLYCGCASIVCGIIFGSYFGYQLTQPLWFDLESVANNRPSHYMLKTSVREIGDVFKLSIFVGVVVVYLSYFFNWINRIKRGELIELLLERNGILGGWMYWVGIQLVWTYVQSNYTSFGDLSSLSLTLILPAVLLFFSEPVKYIFRREHRKKHALSFKLFGAWVGEWIINLFEYAINSLSNTISFIRIAGLGMAHIILMTTFYAMAANHGIFVKILIVILTNVIVIALEGLSAGINSVRLNYYEFFSRYFIGNGRPYKPITVRD